MKRLVVLLPVLVALQVGVSPALAWTWPVDGPVLRPFVLGDDPYAAGQHRGVDVGAPAGATVRAPTGGTVSFSGTVPGGGRTVTIRTQGPHSVTLVHLGTIAVTRGTLVAEGAAVGTVGPSGEAEHAVPYVHLGVRLTDDPNGYLDPLRFLQSRGAEPLPAVEPAQEPRQPAEPESPPPTGQEPAPGGAAADSPTGGTRAEAGEPLSDRARTPRASPLRTGVTARDSAGRSQGEGGTVGSSVLPAEAGENAPRRDGGRAPGLVGSRTSTSAGLPAGATLPRRTSQASFERTDNSARAGSSARSAAVSAGGSEPERRPVVGVLVAFGALGVALAGAWATLAVRRRDLRDAGPADRPPAMLLDGAGSTAEDAHRSRLAEEDRLVLDRDLERIFLGQPEPLPNLDGDDDPAQLVDVANDSRLAHPSLRARSCAHRHRAPCGFRAEPVPARRRRTSFLV
jgi:hypothetical protein